MRACPRCSRTYADVVDFCFEDGEVLEEGAGGTKGVPPTLVPPVERATAPTSSLSASGEVLLVPARRAGPSPEPRDGAAVNIATPLPAPDRNSDTHDDEFEDSVWRIVRNTVLLGVVLGGSAVVVVVLWGGALFGSTTDGEFRLPWMSAPELRAPAPVEQAPIHEDERAVEPVRSRPLRPAEHPPASEQRLPPSTPPAEITPPRRGDVRFVLSNIDGARLKIDGIELPDGGKLPLDGVQLTEGPHRFTVVLPSGMEFQIQRNIVLSERGVTEIRLDAD